MKAVIMCGGSGTRLWPISRKKEPKQFAKIFGEKSLFQHTLLRNIDLVDEYIIVVNEEQLDICHQQIPEILKDKVKFILEPVGRNTAPAITLAAMLASQEDELLVLASDHLIKNNDIYNQCVLSAKSLAQNGFLVTFGITAKYPETGYGYIEAEGNKVLSFKEKPDLQTAIKYVSQGNYFWNSGMFCFSVKKFLNELNEFDPVTYVECEKALSKANINKNQYKILKEDMLKIPENSIDYSIMEKSKSIKVVPSPFYWSDLGSYDSLYEEFDKDDHGNAISSNIKPELFNSHNNLIVSNKKIVCTFDVSELIIVDTEEALLIGKKGKGQKVKEILNNVKKRFPNLA